MPWFPAAVGWALYVVTLFFITIFGENALCSICGWVSLFAIFVSMWWSFVEFLKGNWTASVLYAGALSWGVLFLIYYASMLCGGE